MYALQFRYFWGYVTLAAKWFFFFFFCSVGAGVRRGEFERGRTHKLIAFRNMSCSWSVHDSLDLDIVYGFLALLASGFMLAFPPSIRRASPRSSPPRVVRKCCSVWAPSSCIFARVVGFRTPRRSLETHSTPRYSPLHWMSRTRTSQSSCFPPLGRGKARRGRRSRCATRLPGDTICRGFDLPNHVLSNRRLFFFPK